MTGSAAGVVPAARVEAVGVAGLSVLVEHLERHVKENGTDGDLLFMPFPPGQGPPTRERFDEFARGLRTPTGEPGWWRFFVVRSARGIVAHLNLKGGTLELGRHRCQLGMGIQREHRGKGLGTALLEAAISFATRDDTLAWIDLSVFEHNERAQKLYERHGFVQVGRIEERFRAPSGPVHDVMMTRRVG